jgi:hypothetical protein
MKWLLALAAASLSAASGPSIFFSKSFPAAAPAYCQVVLHKDGGGEYAEAPDEDDPLRFHLSEADAAAVFDLAAKLDYFQRALESPRKVAFMGTKTLRYDDGQQKHEVRFNYSEDPTAQALLNWFERMAEAARDRMELERTAQFDKLGVYQALVTLETDMNQKRVAALDQFLPILDKIASNDAYMHAARQRAAEAAEAIRKAAP